MSGNPDDPRDRDLPEDFVSSGPDDDDLGEPIAELAMLDADVNGTLVRSVRRRIHRRMLANQTFDLTTMGLSEAFRSYLDLAFQAWLESRRPRR
jgi:hypothetical protein